VGTDVSFVLNHDDDSLGPFLAKLANFGCVMPLQFLFSDSVNLAFLKLLSMPNSVCQLHGTLKILSLRAQYRLACDRTSHLLTATFPNPTKEELA
jgi:hypothetical protein